MSLSEDIRLGALLHPQCSAYFDYGDDRTITACCAMGGAWLAQSHHHSALSSFAYMAVWPITSRHVLCPQCLDSARLGHIVAVHLGSDRYGICTGNLRVRWTRERIAEWVESIEQQEVPQPILIDDTKEIMLVSSE